MSEHVCAIVPAYGRPALLARALESLSHQQPALARVFVVNNSSGEDVRRVAADAKMPVTVLEPGCNLGTAGGIGFGMRAMMEERRATHAWVLDDDATALPGALTALLQAMETARAEAAAPLLTDETGRVRWTPWPLTTRGRTCVRQHVTPEAFLARCGAEPQPWRWAIWAGLLLSRRAVEQIGWPRMDLWSQFTDIEYTLRLTARFTGVLAPAAVCGHEPPVSERTEVNRKIYWALQNACYVTLRLPHGRRARRHLPGLFHRYLRHHAWRSGAWLEAGAALFRGGALGLRPCDSEFREPFERAAAAFPEWECGSARRRD